MVDETEGWADGSDDRAAEGLAHLQTAARELIAAARAILDVAEDLVDDPKTVTIVTDAVGGVVRAAAQAGRRAVGVAGTAAAPDGGAEPAGVERIRVDYVRVLRLDLGRTRLVLHPYVTVIRGLGPESRSRLLDVLGGLPRGRTPVGGLIEAHGVLLDLAPVTLSLLDLEAPLDVVVRAGDLPGGANGDDPTRPARRRLAEAEAAVVAAQAGVAEAEGRHQAAVAAAAAGPVVADEPAFDGGRLPAGDRESATIRAVAARDVEVATEDHQLALAALQEAETAAALARDLRGDAAGAVALAVAALDAANDRRDATAGAAVEAARARLAEAEAELESVRSGAASRDVDDQESADALFAERIEVQAALLALDTTDPMPVRLALEQVRAGEHVELQPSAEAERLAAEVEAIEAELLRYGSSAPADPERDHEERVLAQRRVELAAQAVLDLESAARRPVFDSHDVAELEAAHFEVLELRDAAGKRFGSARAVRRLEEVEAIEQAALERMGLVTYTEFLMGGGSNASAPNADESVADRLEAARADLEKAERQLAQREADLVGELARAELLDRRRQLRDRAEELLGHDPGADLADLAGALRRHRVPGSDTGEHLARLRQVLEGAGLAVADEDVEERWLADLAGVWLHEQGETESQRASLEEQIAAVDARLAALEARVAAPALDEPLAVAAGAVEDARKALDAAERRQRRDDTTVAEVEALRTALAEASEVEARAAGELAAAEDAVRATAAVARRYADSVQAAVVALAAADEADAAAVTAAASAEHRLAAVRQEGAAALEAEVVLAVDAVGAANGVLVAARAAAASAQRDLEADIAAATEAGASVKPEVSAEDVEWYLLSRLAAQRSVSYAGSVPLVLDDALVHLEPQATRDVLDRLERMAATVQLIVVTEDLTTAAWAERLGEKRARVAEAG